MAIPNTPFSAGDLVQLQGLSRLELNGQRGRVLPLEFPEQAASTGRLPVVLEATGKRLALKIENLLLVKAPSSTRDRGDLGNAWLAELAQRGPLAGLPLRKPPSPSVGKTLRAASINFGWGCGAGFEDSAVAEQFRSLSTRSSSSSSPASSSLPAAPFDIVASQDCLEGSDVFSRFDFVKLVSSAVKAETLGDNLYSKECTPDNSTRLVVNELYLRSGSAWECCETGVESISTSSLGLAAGSADEGLDASWPLVARSVVWAKLRPKGSAEGPCVLILNARLSGGLPEEDRHYLSSLSEERAKQANRLLELCRLLAQKDDEDCVPVLLGLSSGAAFADPHRFVCFDDYFDEQVLCSPVTMEAAAAAGIDSTQMLEDRFRHYWLGAAQLLSEAPGFSLLRPRETGGPFCEPWVAVGCSSEKASNNAATSSVDVAKSTIESQEDSSAASNLYSCTLSVLVGKAERARVAGGESNLLELPLVGLGTAFTPEDLQNESVADEAYSQLAADRTKLAITTAVACNIRLVETSTSHRNQRTVGAALRSALDSGFCRREELFVAARICRCRSEWEVKQEVDLLLEELQLDYVDLLSMDIPPERVPKAWPWLEKVHREGRARFLGVLNFDLLGHKVCCDVFREFLAEVTIPPAVHAMEVHPLNTNEEMASCCRGLGIQVLAYSPLAAPHKVEAFMRALTRSDAKDMRPLLKLSESAVLKDIGERHGVSSAQVALRWNLQRGHCVVPKSFVEEHIAENSQLFHFALSSKEMAILSGLHKGLRAERFLQQALVQGPKALPRMTREAQDTCEAILAKFRGPGQSGTPGDEQQIQEELAELYRQQEVLKGRGKGFEVPVFKEAGQNGGLGSPAMVQAVKASR